MRGFNDRVAAATAIRCLLVRSGTIPLIVLDGTEIFAGKAGHAVMRRILPDSPGGGRLLQATGGPLAPFPRVTRTADQAMPSTSRIE